MIERVFQFLQSTSSPAMNRKARNSIAAITVFLAYGASVAYYTLLAVPQTDLNAVSHFINRMVLVDSNNNSNIISSNSNGIDDDIINSNINSDETIEELDNNNGNDNRPWMVVHVGPPKTGTTTIQEGLRREDVALRLARDDNVYYMGQVLRKTRYNQTAHYNKHKDHTNNASYPNVTMFRLSYMHPSRPLSHEFRDELESHRRNNRNVFVSSEHFTSKLRHTHKDWHDFWFKDFFLD